MEKPWEGRRKEASRWVPEVEKIRNLYSIDEIREVAECECTGGWQGRGGGGGGRGGGGGGGGRGSTKRNDVPCRFFKPLHPFFHSTVCKLLSGKFDLFCRRVIKLIDMFSTIDQFNSLSENKVRQRQLRHSRRLKKHSPRPSTGRLRRGMVLISSIFLRDTNNIFSCKFRMYDP